MSIPQLGGLLRDSVPAYAWDITDAEPWSPAPKLAVRLARRVLPPSLSAGASSGIGEQFARRLASRDP